MALTRYEQETIINYNRAEKEVSVYSSDPVVMRKLDSLCEEQPLVYKLEKEYRPQGSEEICAKAYTIADKKLIRFAKKREMTEEQREELKQRGKAMFEKRWGKSEEE